MFLKVLFHTRTAAKSVSFEIFVILYVLNHCLALFIINNFVYRFQNDKYPIAVFNSVKLRKVGKEALVYRKCNKFTIQNENKQEIGITTFKNNNYPTLSSGCKLIIDPPRITTIPILLVPPA